MPSTMKQNANKNKKLFLTQNIYFRKTMAAKKLLTNIPSVNGGGLVVIPRHLGRNQSADSLPAINKNKNHQNSNKEIRKNLPNSLS